MRPLTLLLTCLLLGGLQIASVAAETKIPPGEWIRGREQLRQVRAALEKGMLANREERAQKAAKLIADLLPKAKELGAGRNDSDLNDLITGVRFLHAPSAEPLAAILATFSEAGPTDAKQAQAIVSLIESKRRIILQPTEKLFSQALAEGVPAIARDCVDQALVLWPDHRDLRRNLGQTKVGNRWYGPRESELTKAGLVWDDKLGWVVAKEQARYAKGDYFDLQTKTWTTLAAANQRHANQATRWVLQTEHLEIRGTAQLADLVDAANRLEQFYDRVFAAYANFFIKPGKRSANDIRLLFGTFDHPRLVVNIARDEKDYQTSLPKGVAAGWSAGMFIPMTKETYFYAGPTEVIYHEFTHQILHLFSGQNDGPAWLVEGAAVYTQAPVFVEGRMVLGDLQDNHHIRGFFHQLKLGKALSLAKTLALEDQGAWGRSPTPDLNYPAAGALVQFAMEAENRKYRSDFIDFLRDSYLGTTRGFRLWEYLGMDYPRFEKAYAEWVNAGLPRATRVAP